MEKLIRLLRLVVALSLFPPFVFADAPRAKRVKHGYWDPKIVTVIQTKVGGGLKWKK